jgi:hypothetical protein
MSFVRPIIGKGVVRSYAYRGLQLMAVQSDALPPFLEAAT